ncbi:WD40 repeat domain-containing protein [Streptomyces capparidis]
MRALLVPAAVAALLVPAAAPRAAAASSDSGPKVAFSFSDDRIAEASGLAASRRHEGVYWTHNDSADGPYVYAVDSSGRTVATVTLRGVDPRDVEAVSVTPDGEVHLGDIGDNLGGKWPEVWIYRFTEPERLADTTVDAVRHRVRYADGPRDAEAMMVHPRTGRVYIASKKEGGGGLYEGPAELSASQVNTFRRVGDVPWVTDGSFSPDGNHLVLRGYFWAARYTWRDGQAGRISGRRSLELPIQRQGEAVAYGADGRFVLYASEGAGSEVWRLDLPADGGSGGGGGEGKGKGDSGSAAAERSAGGDDEDNTTTGFAVLAAAGLAALLLRLLWRRRRG